MAASEKLKTENAAGELTREQVRELVRTAPEAVVDLVMGLQEQVRLLREETQRLRQEVQELKGRLAQNSRNSHKPPGSDGLGKPSTPKSLRSKSGRKAGGQPGHPGHTLKQVENPGRTIVHGVGERCRCGACEGVSLAGEPGLGYEKRQIFELPALRLEVTEHRAEIKRCPCSGRKVRALFPEGVKAPAQYGPQFRSLLVYLSHQQLIPFERVGQICEDLFGQPVSLATVREASQGAFDSMEDFETRVIESLRSVPVLHSDESGLRVEGKLHWLHSAGTDRLTFYQVHPKRGVEAMDAAGILPHREDWVMHDCWQPYFQYECAHALCNQHLLRELNFLKEEQGQAWAGEMMELLGEFHRIAKSKTVPGEKEIEACHGRYDALLRKARMLHPRRPEGARRGKQSKAGNLLERLEDYSQCYLAFLSDPRVPFTNNQAEQDIRMVKIKQKISGSFRTLKGARIFARIRGFISTARKQGRNLLQSIAEALIGSTFIPIASS